MLFSWYPLCLTYVLLIFERNLIVWIRKESHRISESNFSNFGIRNFCWKIGSLNFGIWDFRWAIASNFDIELSPKEDSSGLPRYLELVLSGDFIRDLNQV